MGHARFILGPKFKHPVLEKRDEKVCVVSIVGKSRHHVSLGKAALLNPLLNADVFIRPPPADNSPYEDDSVEASGRASEVDIEGYFDEENNVVYLHLLTVYDVSRLLAAAGTSASDGGPAADLVLQQYQQARALLLLFSISHLVLLHHPGHAFDITYVRLFRLLDSMRVKLSPHASEALQGAGVSPTWHANARPCSPRVLFIFQTPPHHPPRRADDTDKAGKRVQHAMEDEIYRILRRARIITNTSNNSLFAVPANQEFVYICGAGDTPTPPTDFYLAQLAGRPAHRGYQAGRPTHAGHEGRPTQRAPPAPDTPAATTGPTTSLKSFVRSHVAVAMDKGFDDNVGRSPVPAEFELVGGAAWVHAARRLYDFYLLDHEDQGRQYFNTLKSSLEIDARFSDSRCSKVLPQAERVYQEGSPHHYARVYHDQRLAAAKRAFTAHARGPAVPRFLTQLEARCEAWWRVGREACEALSLTGNPCAHELHVTPEQAADAVTSLPIMRHSSALRVTAACNCGRTQSDRDDPFHHRHANFDFYEAVGEGCCALLVHITLPVFEASTANIRPAAGAAPAAALPPAVATLLAVGKADTAPPTASSLSLALSLGQSDSSDIYAAADAIEPRSHTDQSQARGSQSLNQSEARTGGLSQVDSQSEESLGPGPPVSESDDSQDVLGEQTEGVMEEERHTSSVSYTEDGIILLNNDKSDKSSTHQVILQEGTTSTADVEPCSEQTSVPALEYNHEDSELPSVAPVIDETCDSLAELNIGATTEPSSAAEALTTNEAAPSETEALTHTACVTSVEADDSAIMVASLPAREHSTIEYLPGMINSLSPPGRLPVFASWSLCSLGKYTTYNASTGFDWPGFLHGANFLLPWDLTVRGDRWPALEGACKKAVKYRKGREGGEMTVRVYVGSEYECPRGHRFFCSAPDKMLKVPPSGFHKETAYRLVHLDMPLYFPCHCRGQPAGYYGQLMRCYVSVPEGPVQVSLQPQVVPGPGPCPVFHPGTPGPIALRPGELWVLRLPAVYQGENTVHRMPTESHHIDECRLLKGLYHFVTNP